MQLISETTPISKFCKSRETNYRTMLIILMKIERSIGTAWIQEDLIRLAPKQILLETLSIAQMWTNTTLETSLLHNRLILITKLQNQTLVNFSVSADLSKSILMMHSRLWYPPKHNGAQSNKSSWSAKLGSILFLFQHNKPLNNLQSTCLMLPSLS